MLTGDEIVDVWAVGHTDTPAYGSLALLARLGHDVTTITPGARDRALLDLHAATFSPELDAVATCSACGELLEVSVPIDELVASVPPPAGRREMRDGAVYVAFRLPTVADLLVGPLDGHALLDACITQASVAGVEVAATSLPQHVRDAVETAMQEGDPWADLTIGLACPACATEWEVGLEPAQFVWAAVAEATRSVVDEVVDLASAFGWSEQAILAMTPGRRRLYLERVRTW
jgi:hypothetical protein